MTNIVWNLVMLVIGFVFLIKGADWFVEGASKVAEKFGIPQLVIGLTIVALGTSLPEAAVSVTSALKGSADITVGNVVGSNILNILIILGITAVICPLTVQRSTVKYELPFVVVISCILFGIGYTDNTLGRIDGCILWGLLVVYLIYLLQMTKKGEVEPEEQPDDGKPTPVWQLPVMIIVGGIMIVWGADLAVDGATGLARSFGMTERMIGLTIVALGTSLPELVTSVTAAIKGKADIAVGNIVGSNIFNILFVVGTSALITAVPYAADFFVDSIVCILAAVLLWVCVVKDNKLGRIGGAVMLVAYAAYFVNLIRG